MIRDICINNKLAFGGGVGWIGIKTNNDPGVANIVPVGFTKGGDIKLIHGQIGNLANQEWGYGRLFQAESSKGGFGSEEE
ncbi:hypothetical protein DSO57_1034983 [Entomophthora muscae]|uniref:Uncharacterized protein n=1 Tax=Entomophthora muscae TaxID=34485 RepID=A0ACC2REJ3_9FUNG|nr:hypothetical protein DSO57_1034983 [Entomophthora muscae]